MDSLLVQPTEVIERIFATSVFGTWLTSVFGRLSASRQQLPFRLLTDCSAQERVMCAVVGSHDLFCSFLQLNKRASRLIKRSPDAKPGYPDCEPVREICWAGAADSIDFGMHRQHRAHRL